MASKLIHYKAPPTLSRFHHDTSLVRCVLGAIGSGKSVGCCAEIVRMAGLQRPNPDGIRYTRFAIIRNTIKELKDTTIKTWLDWYGDLGEMRWTDLNFHLKFGDVDCEILFRGLDRPDQVKSLLSLELTGAFINEAKEVQPEIIQTVISRLGRYPAKKDGIGCTYPSLIMDSNFPSEDSFIYRMFEEEKPLGWALFKQAGGLSPLAENLENLPDTYYTTQMAGKDENWLRVYRDAQYGFVMDGKAVFPEYTEAVHLFEGEWKPDPKRPILVGMDFGRTPVAVLAQKDAFGRWMLFDELQCWDMGAEQFGKLLYAKLSEEYAGFKVKAWGDPAGDDRSQVDDRTPMMMIVKAGVPMVKSPSQDPFVRIESVRSPMMRMYDGEPAFMITPRCKMLRKALGGGYQYKRIQVAGSARYTDKPDKNEYSHVSDALQYLMVGGGEAVGLVRREGGDFEKQAMMASGGFASMPTAGDDWSPFSDM